MASVSPSAKYSSPDPPKFRNGSTTSLCEAAPSPELSRSVRRHAKSAPNPSTRPRTRGSGRVERADERGARGSEDAASANSAAVWKRSAGVRANAVPPRPPPVREHGRAWHAAGEESFREPPRDDRLCSRPGERRLAGQHLVEHAAERVQVAAGRRLALTRRLFRADVGRRAHRHPRLGEPGRRRPPRAPGRCRNRPPGPPPVRGGCFRFDVAMHQVLIVGVVRSTSATSLVMRSACSIGSWPSCRRRSRRLSPSTYGMVYHKIPSVSPESRSGRM